MKHGFKLFCIFFATARFVFFDGLFIFSQKIIDRNAEIFRKAQKGAYIRHAFAAFPLRNRFVAVIEVASKL